jgi:superfamily II DNA/RNA helicase
MCIIGRTARAGADGVAISLCDREAFLRDIEKLIRSDSRDETHGGASVPQPVAQDGVQTPVQAPALGTTQVAPGRGWQPHRNGGHRQHNGKSRHQIIRVVTKTSLADQITSAAGKTVNAIIKASRITSKTVLAAIRTSNATAGRAANRNQRTTGRR